MTKANETMTKAAHKIALFDFSIFTTFFVSFSLALFQRALLVFTHDSDSEPSYYLTDFT
jgi:hypothetical protein